MPRKGRIGPTNPNWKGGRSVTPDGYVLIRKPEHPGADVRGYIYEHRLVAEEHLGRYLEPGEEVHHENLNRSDNRWENLTVEPSRAAHFVHHRHSKMHSRAVRLPGEENPTIGCACGCGETFPKYDKWNRQRSYISGYNGRRVHG